MRKDIMKGAFGMGKVIALADLTGLNYESGAMLLEQAGYIQNDSAIDDGCNGGYDYISDTYFTLYDEEDEEIDIKSYAEYYKKNPDPLNDDRSGDFVIRAEWVEV